MRANPAWHEEARLLRDAGVGVEEIARKFGKTLSGVSYATRGCSGRKSRRGTDQWGSAADAFIIEHYGPLSASKIARRLGVSRNAIIGRVFRLRQRANEVAA